MNNSAFAEAWIKITQPTGSSSWEQTTQKLGGSVSRAENEQYRPSPAATVSHTSVSFPRRPAALPRILISTMGPLKTFTPCLTKFSHLVQCTHTFSAFSFPTQEKASPRFFICALVSPELVLRSAPSSLVRRISPRAASCPFQPSSSPRLSLRL